MSASARMHALLEAYAVGTKRQWASGPVIKTKDGWRRIKRDMRQRGLAKLSPTGGAPVATPGSRPSSAASGAKPLEKPIGSRKKSAQGLKQKLLRTRAARQTSTRPKKKLTSKIREILKSLEKTHFARIKKGLAQIRRALLPNGEVRP